MIDSHKSEAAADFRSVYGVSLWAVPLPELWHLVTMLLKDPTSRLHAASAGWEFPVSREWIALADLVDVQLASKSKRKPKPYVRPWDKKPARMGGKPMSIGELRAKLEAFDGKGQVQGDVGQSVLEGGEI